jgi:hypothetical protein
MHIIHVLQHSCALYFLIMKACSFSGVAMSNTQFGITNSNGCCDNKQSTTKLMFTYLLEADRVKSKKRSILDIE